LCSWRCL